MSKGVQIALATLTVFGALAWILTSGANGEGTFRYYSNVADFVTNDGDANDGMSRVHGFVVTGSIRKDLPAGHVDFRIQDADQPSALEVRFLSIDVPDLFRDGAEVVVEGRLDDGTFLADRVMAKCPSKYEAEETEA